jgi:hypothetical protein
MLISPVLDGDTAHAAPVAAPSKSDLDRREVNRRAVKFFATIRPMLTDMHGFSLIRHLGPNPPAPSPNGRVRGAPGAKIDMFRGPSPYENADGSGPGAWVDVGTGASGSDLISLIETLGECDRKTATTFLKDLTDRLVEIAK